MRFLLFLSLLFLPVVGTAQNRPQVSATHIGTYEVSQGAAWQDLTSDEFTTSTSRAIADGLCFASVTVTNTHATQTLRLLLKANGGAGAISILVPAGTSLSVPTYGAGVTTISIRGSGAATTGQVIALLVSGGC